MISDKIFARIKNGHPISFEPDGGYDLYPNPSRDILPGSFNPLHKGHKALYDHARNQPGSNNLSFEISINIVDKGEISKEDLWARIKQFDWFAPVIVTNFGRFSEKTKWLDCGKIIIGLDTAKRILRDYSVAEIESWWHSKFIVYPRIMDGKAIEIEESFPYNFELIRDYSPVDISSSQLRNLES